MSPGLKVAIPLFWLGALGVCSVMSTPWNMSHLSLVPNAATGQVIPLSVRGTGTVYLDAAEWSKMAPYWYFYTISLWSGATFGLTWLGLNRIRHYRRLRDHFRKRKSEPPVDWWGEQNKE